MKMRIWSAGCLVLALSSPLSAQDDNVMLEPREKWTNLPADARTDVNFTLKTPARIQRFIDALPALYLVGAVACALNHRRQRLV